MHPKGPIPVPAGAVWPVVGLVQVPCRKTRGLHLVREIKIFKCHVECVREYWNGFSDTNKKQITEPVRKLRDKSNDTN
jgi:hypothetical protein